MDPSTSNTEPEHPFAHSTGLLEIIPNKIDIEEESRLYEDLCYVEDDRASAARSNKTRLYSPEPTPSIFSKDIWLDDHSGESLTFARDVEITGWTNVGDKLNGAYVVYNCAIKTKEGTVIHVHKRYSAFVELDLTLRHTLPRALAASVPPLPPKAPLSRYRSAFLNRRRRMLQSWLSSVLLHPEIGGCKAVRLWVMD